MSASAVATVDTKAELRSAIADTSTPPGKRLSLDVLVKSVAMRGDTIHVVMQVKNRSSSKDSLLTFMVDAPHGITRIQIPSPPIEWDTATDVRSRPVAYWALLELLAPGMTTPDLEYESVGIPGIADYWAQGHARAGFDEDEASVDTLSTTFNALTTEMINGKTLGIERWPADRSAPALLKRLQSLTSQVCSPTFGWINDTRLCSRLSAYVDEAEKSWNPGQTREAKEAIAHFLGLLTEANGQLGVDRLTSAGFWLLRSNAHIAEAAVNGQ